MNRLIQFQCEREGTLFYYQTDLKRIPFQISCPVCRSTRTSQTGREFSPVDETAEPTAYAQQIAKRNR